MKKILITGATGFVGSEVMVQLGNLDQVGVVAAVRKKLPSQPDNYIEVGELDSSTDFTDALAGVDTVIHIAARAHIMKDEVADPLAEYRRVNVAGTLNLAKQAVEAGVKRFVYISSIKVNGESTTGRGAFIEDEKPSPEDDYGLSKFEAEEALLKLADETSLEVVIIRPPLVYGAGVKANFLSLMKLSLKSLPLPFGSVKNNRSMVFVRNLADFIIQAAQHPKAANEIFVISDGQDTSLANLISSIRKSADKPRRLLPVPISLFKFVGAVTGKKGVVDRLVGDLQVDSSKARSLLDWQPPYSFAKGIELTVKSFIQEGKQDD